MWKCVGLLEGENKTLERKRKALVWGQRVHVERRPGRNEIKC